MSIIRIKKKEHPYVQVDKRVLEDSRLSWRAKGILVYLLTKPDGWTVKVADIWGKGTEGRNAVQACLEELRVIGYAQLVAIVGTGNKFLGKEWEVSEEPTGGFLEFTDKPKKDAPINRKSGNRGVNSNNESLSEINSNNEGERTPPAPENQNIQSQKNEEGKVAQGRAENHKIGALSWQDCIDECAENAETVKAEISPSKKVAPKKVSPFPECQNCNGTGFDQKKMWGCCDECEGSGQANPSNINFEVTAIASPTDLPGVMIVDAPPKLQPLPRVSTTIEAETKITEWISGEGLETVKHRFSIAKQRFDPDNAAAIAAHYCSVYTKSAANKGRLLEDPITHFSDGLFSYLKNEESFGRNNAPKENGLTRNGNPQNSSALPASLRNLIGK
jgi:hypothetical protein